VLSRNPDRYTRETKLDLHKLPRNYDPALHPFEAQREYTRALNAVKLERVFAKPFLASLDGHADMVTLLQKHPTQLSSLFSASADGIVSFALLMNNFTFIYKTILLQVKQWNIPLRTCTRTIQAHAGYVRGMTFTPDGETLISVGDDKNIRFWPVNPLLTTNDGDGPSTAKHSIITKVNLLAIKGSNV
jgi:WD repeat and SOF domain-containing protein 1